MTKENERSEILCACVERAEVNVSAPDTTGESVGTTARSDKVETSEERKPRRCKEKKVHEPQVGGVFQRRTSTLEPGKKNQGLSLIIFLSLGYIAYNCLVDAVVSCFHINFFLPAIACYLVVN